MRLAWALALLIGCVVWISGCSINDASEKVEKREITFWYGLEGVLGDYVEQLIADFNASQDEIVVVGHRQGNYSETLNSLEMAIATDTSPSVALLEQRGIVSLMKRDALLSLDELTGKNGVTIQDIPKQFLDVFITDNHIYSLPMYATVWVTYLRNDYVKGHFDNKTSVSFHQVMDTIKAHNTDLAGGEKRWVFSMINEDTTLINAALSNGAKFINENHDKVLLDKPEWIEVWEQFRHWIHEDKLISYYNQNLGWDDYYEVLNDVVVGRAVGCISSVSDKDIFEEAETTTLLHLGWKEKMAKPVTYAIGLVIPRNIAPEEKEAAGKWIRYLMDAEVNAKWITLSGYLPGNLKAYETDLYKDYAEEHEIIKVARKQFASTSSPYYDPTGGKINEAVIEAARKLINENVRADIVLKEAQEKAQKELDRVSGN